VFAARDSRRRPVLDSSDHLTENSGSMNGAKFLDQLSERRTAFHIGALNLSGCCLFVETEFCPLVTVYKYQQQRIKICRVIRRYSLLNIVSISEIFDPHNCNISSVC
jgi:hypothetical protein